MLVASQTVEVAKYSTWSNIFVAINENVDFEAHGFAVGANVTFDGFPTINGITERINGPHIVRSLFTQRGVVRGFSILLQAVYYTVPDIALFAGTLPTVRLTSAPRTTHPPQVVAERRPPPLPTRAMPPPPVAA